MMHLTIHQTMIFICAFNYVIFTCMMHLTIHLTMIFICVSFGGMQMNKASLHKKDLLDMCAKGFGEGILLNMT